MRNNKQNSFSKMLNAKFDAWGINPKHLIETLQGDNELDQDSVNNEVLDKEETTEVIMRIDMRKNLLDLLSEEMEVCNG